MVLGEDLCNFLDLKQAIDEDRSAPARFAGAVVFVADTWSQ